MTIGDLDQAQERPLQPALRKRTVFFIVAGVLVLGSVVAALYFLFRPDLSGRIVIPYIAHQPPLVDPHLPSANALADKLDEVLFDGLFNITANPNGVVYENGLGELIGIDARNVVTVRLRPGVVWHDSYSVWADGDNVQATRAGEPHTFSASDLAFTLQRIQRLGTLSPDYILVSQALEPMAFEGPNEVGEVLFRFKSGRIWKDADIREVLSFKILPANEEINALQYLNGTGPYMRIPRDAEALRFYSPLENPVGIRTVKLVPFIDNSTFTTEYRTGSINVLLETPFGSIPPILGPEDGFPKSNISTTFFAVLFNVQRLNREQRRQARLLLDGRAILERFFMINTPQQRSIIDYKGNQNNFYDYLNTSVFPSSSYYIEEEILDPEPQSAERNFQILPDTLRIKACVNSGFREEYTELIGILNDPSVTQGRVKVLAVPNEDLQRGDYDAVLVAFSGYRSNFLFDLYNVFLRAPDLDMYRINLMTEEDHRGNTHVSTASFTADRNFFRLDARATDEAEDIRTLLDYVYGFMSTRQVGDKQEYARRVDALERKMALGAWLFSLPSLAFFSNQFDPQTINLYGVASQLSTIEQWKERQTP